MGSTVTFTLTLTNDGPDTATNVEVTDTLPNGYEYVASSIAGADGRNDSDTSSLKWTVNSIANDGVVTVSYQAKILASGSYKNTAEVTASDQPDPDSSPGNDSGDQSEDDEAAVTVVPVIVPPGPVVLSGVVFEEVSGIYDGLKTTEQPTSGGGGLYACIDTTPARYASVGATSTGAFAFAG